MEELVRQAAFLRKGKSRMIEILNIIKMVIDIIAAILQLIDQFN